MTEKSFTPVSEVLKKETTTTETNSKKIHDWSEAEDNEDAWGNIAPEVVVSIGEIQEQQKEEVDKRSWPKNEGEEKKNERGVYKPPGSGYNNNNISNTRRERPPPSNIIPDAPPYQLKVNNLNYKVVEDDLGDFFGELGVKSIRILRDRDTKRSRGSAIIEFNERSGLENALKAGGTNFHGREMDVSVFENRPRENNNRFGSGGGSGSGSGPERKRYNFRQDQPESTNDDEGGPRERKKLNIQQRTLPLEERHINPGSINPGSEEKEEKKEQPRREETVSERKERENPFGKASPIVTKYSEKPQPKEEEKPPQQPKDDKFSRPFQKRNNGYNNDRIPKKNYDTNQDVPSVRGGNNSWNTRGGKKTQPRRGGSQPTGQPRTSFNLKRDEQVGGLETQNHYQVLFEGGDEEEEVKN